MFMGRIVLGIAVLAVVGYVLAAAYLYFFQEQFVYRPSTRIEVTPASVGMYYEEVALVASDGVRLNGWYLPLVDARGTVLFATAMRATYRICSQWPRMHIGWVWEFCCLTIAAMVRARGRPLRKERTAMPRRLGTTWCRRLG